MRVETLILMCSFFNFNSPLKWVSTGLGNINDSFISLETTRSDIKIDLSETDQVTILKDVQHWNWTITIYCSAIGFNEESRLTFYFCHKWSEKCVDSKTVQWTDKYGNKFYIEELSGPLKGIKIVFISLDRGKLYEYFYNCKAIDSVSGLSIQSNFVLLREEFYWEQYPFWGSDINRKSVYDKVISKRKLPLTFPCLTSKGAYYDNLIFWAVCPVKKDFEKTFAEERVTFANCAHYLTSKWDKEDPKLKPEDIRDKAEFTSNIDYQGNLHIFDIKYQRNQTGLTYAFMCYRKDEGTVVPINTYINQYKDDEIISGVIFDFSVSQYGGTLTPISEKVQQVKVYEKQIPKFLRRNNSFAIYANYTSSSNVQYKWFHDGIALKKTKDIEFDQYRVLFVGDIKEEHKGNYTLKVWDKTDELVFTIIVRVMGSLTLIDRSCLPPLKHVWEFEDLFLRCEYSGGQLYWNYFLINDLQISEDGSERQNKLELERRYLHLKDLQYNYSLKEVNSRAIVALEYSVHNITKTDNEMRYQDHSVTFKARSRIQSIVRSCTIYVVPLVHSQITQFPLSTSCTRPCNSSNSHTFKCRFNADQYKNKGLIVDHYWSINGQRLDNSNSNNIFAPYFTMDPITKDLKLLPIHPNNTKQNDDVIRTLVSNYLVCQIELKSVDESPSTFHYRSDEDMNIREKLKAKIELEYVIPNMYGSENIYTDYARWVVPTIIIGIIIIIIIGLVIVYRDRLNKFEKCFRSENKDEQLEGGIEEEGSEKKDERLKREMEEEEEEEEERLYQGSQIEKYSNLFIHMPMLPKSEGSAKSTTSA